MESRSASCGRAGRSCHEYWRWRLARSAYPVAADGKLGIARRVLGKIAHRLFPFHADDRAAARLRDQVVGDQCRASAGRNRDRNTHACLAYDVAGDRDVAKILPEADADAGMGSVLDDIS